MKRIVLALLLIVPIGIAAPLAFADDGSGSANAIVTTGSGSVGSAATPDVAKPTAGSAATVPSIPDVTAHPAEAATTAWGLLKQYGWLWGAMLVLFAIGTAIVKANDSTHWLSKDHTLPIVVGGVGLVGSALQAHFAGGSWAGVFATLFGVVMLIIQKPTPGTGTTTSATTPVAAPK